MLKPGVEPEDAARIILALVDGLQLQWLYDRDDVHVAESLRLLMSALISVPLSELDEPEK